MPEGLVDGIVAALESDAPAPAPEPEPSGSAPAPMPDVETGQAPATGKETDLKATVQRLAAELATVKQALAL